jgi:hypothetical protein
MNGNNRNKVTASIIFISLALIITQLYLIYKFFIQLIPFKFHDTWILYADRHSKYFQYFFKETVNFEITAILLFICISIVLWVLISKRNQSFPIIFIIYLAAILIFTIADFLLMIQMPLITTEDAQLLLLRTMLGAGIICIVFIPYLIYSKSIKQTFVLKL